MRPGERSQSPGEGVARAGRSAAATVVTGDGMVGAADSGGQLDQRERVARGLGEQPTAYADGRSAALASSSSAAASADNGWTVSSAGRPVVPPGRNAVPDRGEQRRSAPTRGGGRGTPARRGWTDPATARPRRAAAPEPSRPPPRAGSGPPGRRRNLRHGDLSDAKRCTQRLPLSGGSTPRLSRTGRSNWCSPA